jgi:ankyrin repeat protein
LLDWGAKVDHQTWKKEIPLYYAAWRSHLSVVKLLVERGANVRLKNYNGQTPYDVARDAKKNVVADWLKW